MTSWSKGEKKKVFQVLKIYRPQIVLETASPDSMPCQNQKINFKKMLLGSHFDDPPKHCLTKKKHI